MKNFQALNRLCFIFIVTICTSFVLNACELPVFQLKNCLSSQTWQTWSSDYNQVKEVCADLPFDINVYCSKGSLPYGDEVCVYEIINGVETLLFCENASTFSFAPEEGKTYKIETLTAGSSSFSVSFTAVNCLDFDVTQNNGCDAIYENSPVTFNMPDFASDCYFTEWDFGDGSDTQYGDGSTSHQYDLNLSDPCQTCETFIVTVTLNNEACFDDCPELEFEKEVTICRETYFTTGYDSYTMICHDDPCIVLGDYSNSPFNIPLCYYDGYSFEWTITDNFGIVVATLPELQTTYCPAIEGQYSLTMTDPWGCTFTKSFYAYRSADPDSTIVHHTLCSEDQQMIFASPGGCQNIEYDPLYVTLPYTSPVTIRCYDEWGCLSSVYIHVPIYEIEEACISPIEDICEGDDLIVDGSCSGNHLKHSWSIYEIDGSNETLLWTKTYKNKWPWKPNIAGVKNLSNESGICFVVGKCYKIELSIGYLCQGELHWNTTIQEFCVNPKPPCFGGSDIVLDPCVTDCVTIGLDGYSDVIPYPYSNLTHVWEDGTQGVYRSVCPTETTTYTLTTTNEFGCVCVDEVTVTVLEHEPMQSSLFPICFSNPEDSGICQMEVCVDIQINTGLNCECPYMVTRLCHVIPQGESHCFTLEELEMPENACAALIGSQYNLGGNTAILEGPDFPYSTEFYGDVEPCNLYTTLIFDIQADDMIVLLPSYSQESYTSADQDIETKHIQKTSVIKDDEGAHTRALDMEEWDITLYPNPVTTQIKIETSEVLQSVQIFSVQGRLVYDHAYEGQNQDQRTIDLSGVNNGVYIVKISTANQVLTRSIIVNH